MAEEKSGMLAKEEKTGLPSGFYSVRMRASMAGRHLSGGEDLLEEEGLESGIHRLLLQGLGSCDRSSRQELSLSIKVEGVRESALKRCALLPVRQLASDNPETTRSFLEEALRALLKEKSGASETARKVLEQVRLFLEPGYPAEWGATLMSSSGKIISLPDGGVRTSHIGILPTVRKQLMEEAQSAGITGRRFPEALMLATKVTAHPLVLLEVCLSDDPGYTTGYIATQKTGYIRLPHLKPEGHPGGGRIYLLGKNPTRSEILELTLSLTKQAVLFDSIMSIAPPSSSPDLLDHLSRETE